MDSKICKKDSEHLKIPPNMRLLSLSVATEELLGWRRHDDDADIQYWNPPGMGFSRAEMKELDQVRRIILAEDVSTDDDKTEVSAYLQTALSILNQSFLDECMEDVQGVLAHVANGDICIKGWFDDGRLDFEITPRGARRLKFESADAGVFFLWCHGFLGWKALDWPGGYPGDN